MAVAEGQDALIGMDVARMIVEAQLYTRSTQRADQLLRTGYQRAPVIAALPAIVVPREIQHQDIERDVLAPHPRDFAHEVLLVVALEVRLLRLLRAGEVLEVEIGDPGAEHIA